MGNVAAPRVDHHLHLLSPALAAGLLARSTRSGVLATARGRIVYGSDLAIGGNLPAAQSWAAFRAMLPLSEAEFRDIADNVAPYMR